MLFVCTIGTKGLPNEIEIAVDIDNALLGKEL